MATYAIGDIQGCYQHFKQLIELIGFNPTRDLLWLAGDLVNRGPDSLALLRLLMSFEDALITVLGNHDLHLLALTTGAAQYQPGDTLQAILNAPDREILLNWLRHQPLFHHEADYALVHAGLLPTWSITQAADLAQEVETILRSNQFNSFSHYMYGNQPDQWQDALRDNERWRVIINAMTRLRVCSTHGQINFSYKGTLSDIPSGWLPWFDVPQRASKDTTLIFGHWSALGLVQRSDIIALDTGCVWGGYLTAVRLEDRHVFQVPCV